MAVVIAQHTPLPEPGNVHGFAVAWGPLAVGDTGQPIDLLSNADRTLQVEGTFGAAGALQLEGSNDGVNYRVLHDPQGNKLILSQAQITHLTEIPAFMRPNVTGGDGTTSLTLTMFVRKTQR